jgi:hypothetical protein
MIIDRTSPPRTQRDALDTVFEQTFSKIDQQRPFQSRRPQITNHRGKRKTSNYSGIFTMNRAWRRGKSASGPHPVVQFEAVFK